MRIKTATKIHGRTPSAIISKNTLHKVDDTTLTLGMVTKNMLGMESKSSQVVPRKGEAGPGEKAVVKALGPMKVTAVGRVFSCTVRQTTLTGPKGKRVIEDWECP